MAIDRQQMADTIQAGLGTVADALLVPDTPEYQGVAANVVRYAYDPRRAADLIAEAGLTKGADGTLRDADGRRPSLELRTVKEAANEEALYPVADFWQAFGLEVQPLVIPPQRIGDRPYRATFPAFEILGQPDDLHALTRLRSAQTPLPETNFAGTNRVRYMNPEFDALLDRYFTTIPKRERAEALAQVLQFIADQLVWMGLYHQVSPALIGSRLVNVGPPSGGPTEAWNAHEWDVRP
jgi:peptide/nickel transport system substrate-binding protein